MEESDKVQETVEEIRLLQENIKKYREGANTLPPDFEYREAIKRLEFLRNRKRVLRKNKS